MTTITCEKNKFETLLNAMTINGLLPYVGMEINEEGTIHSIQFDKNSSCGAKVVTVGKFRGFQTDGAISFGMDAKKVLGYLESIKGDVPLNIEVQDAYIVFRGGTKKVTTDRLDVNDIDTYDSKPPFAMKEFLPMFKEGTVPTTTHCSIEAKNLADLVKDTKAVEQKQYQMHFKSPNIFKYVARGSSDKRGNDSIESLITDADVEGDEVEAIISAALPEITKVFGTAIIGIHIAHQEKDVFPVWLTMMNDWMRVGYMIPTVNTDEE